jgi:hypothetical protein
VIRCVAKAIWLPLLTAVAAAGGTEDRKVNFGVNGHPLSSPTYNQLSLERQLELLRTLGFRTYRVNINPTHANQFDRLSELTTLASRQEIQVLPVITIPPKQYTDESVAFKDARAALSNMAKRFDGRIPVWELGNEYDLYAVKKDAAGTAPTDYDPEKYSVVRGLIKGMLAGLHEGSPSSRSIVETSQHTNVAVDSGFLERLVQDGVAFDITGYHYYSRDGLLQTSSGGRNSLQILHDGFHRPIWITEFGMHSLSKTIGPSAYPGEEAQALTAGLRQIAHEAERNNVIGADIYELLDQPELLNSPNVNPCQAQFGILDSHGDFTEASTAVQQVLRGYQRPSSPQGARDVGNTEAEPGKSL